MRQHRDVTNSGARRSLTSPAPGGAGFPSGRRPPSRTRVVKRWTRRVGKQAQAASGRSRSVPSTISPATCCSVRCSGTPATTTDRPGEGTPPETVHSPNGSTVNGAPLAPLSCSNAASETSAFTAPVESRARRSMRNCASASPPMGNRPRKASPNAYSGNDFPPRLRPLDAK